eukprot:11191184-Ditylum_brightwellii.AAC.1
MAANAQIKSHYGHGGQASNFLHFSSRYSITPQLSTEKPLASSTIPTTAITSHKHLIRKGKNIFSIYINNCVSRQSKRNGVFIVNSIAYAYSITQDIGWLVIFISNITEPDYTLVDLFPNKFIYRDKVIGDITSPFQKQPVKSQPPPHLKEP